MRFNNEVQPFSPSLVRCKPLKFAASPQPEKEDTLAEVILQLLEKLGDLDSDQWVYKQRLGHAGVFTHPEKPNIRIQRQGNECTIKNWDTDLIFYLDSSSGIWTSNRELVYEFKTGGPLTRVNQSLEAALGQLNTSLNKALEKNPREQKRMAEHSILKKLQRLIAPFLNI